jgi:hypothetical protein
MKLVISIVGVALAFALAYTFGPASMRGDNPDNQTLAEYFLYGIDIILFVILLVLGAIHTWPKWWPF